MGRTPSGPEGQGTGFLQIQAGSETTAASSDLFFVFGRRVVGLGTLDVAALLDQVAHLVWWDRQLALRAGVQGGGDQEVVGSPIPLR